MQTVTLSASDHANGSANNSASAQMKRKPSRRANTAERRATHNAVERQRRETLNGRFLDLAALLPNLSQIRRPSKSSIVNSSIAHVHASRRHRQLSSRELRLLKLEADALRREVNEWRDRAGLPRVEEPVRGEGFTMVLSGEIEVLAAIPDDEDENGGQDGYDDGEEDFAGVGASFGGDDNEAKPVTQANMLNNANANPFAHNMPTSNNLGSNVMPRSAPAPMIATNPATVSFENPAMASLYEPNHPTFTGVNLFQQPQHQMSQQDVEKWNPQMFSQLPQTQRTLFTPPTSAHGLSACAPPSSQSGAGTGAAFQDSATHFFANFQRQQQQQVAGGHMYGSPEIDDGSSIGSGGGRESNSSGYGTPPHASPTGSFDLSSSSASDYTMASRRSSGGLHISSGGYGGADSMGMNMLKQNMSVPISVGGGGNNGGFAMMMM